MCQTTPGLQLQAFAGAPARPSRSTSSSSSSRDAPSIVASVAASSISFADTLTGGAPDGKECDSDDSSGVEGMLLFRLPLFTKARTTGSDGMTAVARKMQIMVKRPDMPKYTKADVRRAAGIAAFVVTRSIDTNSPDMEVPAHTACVYFAGRQPASPNRLLCAMPSARPRTAARRSVIVKVACVPWLSPPRKITSTSGTAVVPMRNSQYPERERTGEKGGDQQSMQRGGQQSKEEG
mmetsp:Transcript_22542/g.62539  ORF Transcript_22542/g.62539 Transcript_22542/m.62539 type:complete len:236 (+) Transcript_22542:805-1512(+)